MPRLILKNNTLLSIGILLLVLSLAATASFLYVRSGVETNPLNTQEKNNSVPDTTSWETYTNKKWGYTIKIPPLLVPREKEGGEYLHFVVFLVSSGVEDTGLAISVSQRELPEEANFIKEKLKNEGGKLVNEEKVEKDKFSGLKMLFEPEGAEELTPRAVVIVNNGRLSYSLSSSPEAIENVLALFTFLD